PLHMRCTFSSVVPEIDLAFMISVHVVGVILTVLKKGGKVLRFRSCRLTFGLGLSKRTFTVSLICFLILIGWELRWVFVLRSRPVMKMRHWYVSVNGMHRREKRPGLQIRPRAKITMLPLRGRCVSFSKVRSGKNMSLNTLFLTKLSSTMR